ncbi:hypothetical protein ACIBK8_11105 [Streptomyces sp. NPDC050161]|uniref:hypothetical protein n=1 Tax=Streptomyces sp. NPDC050161 TaxID=3365604 RepID=UPI0037B5E0E1
MQQRTRTRAHIRTRIRAAVAAGLVLATAVTVGGCGRSHGRGGFIGGIGGGPDHVVSAPSYSPAADPYATSTPDPYGTPADGASDDPYAPSSSPTQEYFDPDGRSDVDGSGCDFSESLHQFSYTVSVTNPSSSDSFSYDMEVNWMKSKPADGHTYGRHQRSIVVGPGDTETYTARYTVNQSSFARFWFTCEITKADKSRM